MKIKTLIAAVTLGLGTSTLVHAAVDASMAARLGDQLTPTGAIQAGNEDGSIPAWNGGGIENIPADFEPGSGNYSDPFADDKILYTVTADNLSEYADLLSEGQKAMFEKYGAEGYRINVYPSRRTFAAPEWYYEGSRVNATGAVLENDGQRITGNVPGVPFPIPQTGLEALWNHMIRWLGYEYRLVSDSYYVDASGKPVLASTAANSWEFPMYMPHINPERKYRSKDLRWSYLRSDFKAPARRAGEILLVHEPGADYTEGRGRSAWQYLMGQRRVRKAPAVSFDTPRPASAGTSTYDDAYMYNGSPERYDWKLVGRKEMLVPYNNYEAVFERDIVELLDSRFVKPDALRYEKHRVWIVEGTLKDGVRHVYGKRRFLIDEDSWNIVENARWDRNGKLWRVGINVAALMWDVPAPIATAELSYDLINGIYNFTGKPNPGTLVTATDKSLQYFTPQGMARTGIR